MLRGARASLGSKKLKKIGGSIFGRGGGGRGRGEEDRENSVWMGDKLKGNVYDSSSVWCGL